MPEETAHPAFATPKSAGPESSRPLVPAYDAQALSRHLDGPIHTVSEGQGIHIHTTDAVAWEDFDVRFAVAPSVKLFVVLEGSIEIQIDGRCIVIGGEDAAVAELIAFPSATTITRICRRGERVRKAVVTVQRSWFARQQASGAEIPSDLTAFLDRPCASLQWVPSARMLRDAEGIINGVAEGSLLFRIASERMALDLLAEALSQFDDTPAPAIDAPGCPARMAEIRQRLKERCSETFSISSFAREVGMSERSLQRAFRSSTGMAVAAYVRRCRLERARAALAEDAVSVTEAAAMAGYATPSSFATAFARQYGAPPSQARSVVSKAR